MRLDPKKIAPLTELTGMALRLQQSKVAALQAKDAALVGQLQKLEDDVRARAAGCGGAADAALQAGADMMWHRWIEGRKIAINQERALLLHQIELERAKLAEEFGRSHVTDKLYERSKELERLMESRRS